jgi:hypothetical protein
LARSQKSSEIVHGFMAFMKHSYTTRTAKYQQDTTNTNYLQESSQ